MLDLDVAKHRAHSELCSGHLPLVTVQEAFGLQPVENVSETLSIATLDGASLTYLGPRPLTAIGVIVGTFECWRTFQAALHVCAI